MAALPRSCSHFSALNEGLSGLSSPDPVDSNVRRIADWSEIPDSGLSVRQFPVFANFPFQFANFPIVDFHFANMQRSLGREVAEVTEQE